MANLRLLLATMLVASLVAAPAASALYVITPLKIRASDDTPSVGDTVTLLVARDPEYDGDSLAGRTVTLRYSFDPQEGAEGSEPPAEGQATSELRVIGTLTLDGNESGSLAWTIPAELDDHNAFLTAVDENGEEVGVGYGPIAVGDAPPIMMIMRGGPSEGAPEPVDDGGATQPPATQTDDADEAAAKDTPGLGLLTHLAVAGLAAFALRSRRA